LELVRLGLFERHWGLNLVSLRIAIALICHLALGKVAQFDLGILTDDAHRTLELLLSKIRIMILPFFSLLLVQSLVVLQIEVLLLGSGTIIGSKLIIGGLRLNFQG